MSSYRMHPRTEGNYRRQTGWDSCAGVTKVPKLAYCVACEKRRTEATGEWKDGAFYCGRHK